MAFTPADRLWHPGPSGPMGAAEFMVRRNDWSDTSHALWARCRSCLPFRGVAHLSLHRLYLYHAVDNPGSCAVARAAGFAHEGTLREPFRYADGAYHDEHLHSLLASDFNVAAGPERAGLRTED